ncbi:arginase [Halalkalibacillus halophilus]|uniref:arginase n=1 Tax=Halalkalibacillus halophilus TaxID=392827 RepID=UPI000407B75E|nr:arginase [Halalkalibacillus halophilus]
MNKMIGIIGAPLTVAQPNDGVDFGPDAIRYAGLHKHLEALNLDMSDYGNVSIENTRNHSIDPKTNLRNLDQVAQGNIEIANKVNEIYNKDEFPLILGGDHSIAIGTIAGVSDQTRKLGVIWYDAHADLNTAETSPSGNIHGMSLAASIGLGHDRLTSIKGNFPKVDPENIVIIGARSIDDGEKKLIKEKGIKVYSMHEIEEMGMEVVMRETINYLEERTDHVHLSLDVDGIDPIHTPGTGTTVDGGVSYKQTHYAMRMLHDAGILTSAEVVEVNPLLDYKNKTAIVAAEMIAAFLGKKYI